MRRARPPAAWVGWVAVLLLGCDGGATVGDPPAETWLPAPPPTSGQVADSGEVDAGDTDESWGAPDGGEPEPDAGQPAGDAGQPGADAGQPAVDAGAPPPPPFEALFSARPASNARDTTIEAAEIALMDQALPGSRLRLEMYSFTRAAPADALIRAHQRGVDVRVVLDGDARGANGSEVPRLEAALGLARVKSCTSAGGGSSCQGTGIMHNKVLLLSALADGSRNVVVQSSHNLTTAQLTMHNNAVIVRGDAALFAAYEQTFDTLVTDAQNLDTYRIANGSLATRAYFFPRGTGGDTVESILGNVACDATSKVRVAMAFFTSARQAVADALTALDQAGCDVALVVGDDEIPFTAQVGAGVAVTRYPQRSGSWGLHSKYLLIDAPYAGSSAHRRLVFTGSHNYTGPALTSNDETLLRLESAAVFQAFWADWARVKAAALTP